MTRISSDCSSKYGFVAHDGGRQDAVARDGLEHDGGHGHADAADDDGGQARQALGDDVRDIEFAPSAKEHQRQDGDGQPQRPQIESASSPPPDDQEEEQQAAHAARRQADRHFEWIDQQAPGDVAGQQQRSAAQATMGRVRPRLSP
jgi:hypothetical protein